jgi:hypothetical protein
MQSAKSSEPLVPLMLAPQAASLSMNHTTSQFAKVLLDVSSPAIVAKASAMTICVFRSIHDCVMLGVIRIVNPAASWMRGSKIIQPMRFTAGAGSQLASL